MKSLEEYYGCLDTGIDHLQATRKWLKTVRQELIFRYGDNSDVFNTIDFLLTQIDKKQSTNSLSEKRTEKETE